MSHGAYFADLIVIADGGGVVFAIAEAVQLQLTHRDPLTQHLEYLAAKQADSGDEAGAALDRFEARARSPTLTRDRGISLRRLTVSSTSPQPAQRGQILFEAVSRSEPDGAVTPGSRTQHRLGRL